MCRSNDNLSLDGTVDVAELRRLLDEIDRAVGLIPRKQRRAVTDRALREAERRRGDREVHPDSPIAFYNRMMARDDVWELMKRLAENGNCDTEADLNDS